MAVKDYAQIPGGLNCRRIDTISDTHVAGDYALHANWGSTASVAVTAAPNDSRGVITVTSAGSGQGANPTIILTFKDPYPVAPVAIVGRTAGSQLDDVDMTCVCTTTTMTITFRGTPVAAETYGISYIVAG